MGRPYHVRHSGEAIMEPSHDRKKSAPIAAAAFTCVSFPDDGDYVAGVREKVYQPHSHYSITDAVGECIKI
jgi:hypothetical protein